jgi:hypothetical protein
VPRLSVVIPCPGGAAEFDGALVAVLQNRPADCEVLVVHGEPYDDPYALDSEVRFIRASCHDLASLANIGIEQATGEIVHLIGCGLAALEGWTVPALAQFKDPEVAAVSPVVLAADRQRVHSAGVRWSLGGARQVVANQRVLLAGAGRQRSKILGPTLAAGFYRREVLVALGGFEVGLGDSLADVAAALAIRSLGRLHVCEPASRLFLSEDRPNKASCGFAAGRAAERLFWRHASSGGMALSVGLHTASVVADVLRQAPHLAALTSLAGRIAAWCEVGSVQRHQQHIAAAAEQLEELAKLQSVIRLPASSVQPAADAKTSRRRAA